MGNNISIQTLIPFKIFFKANGIESHLDCEEAIVPPEDVSSNNLILDVDVSGLIHILMICTIFTYVLRNHFIDM